MQGLYDHFKLPTLLIGDFNHVEYQSDKLGGSESIKGWDSFIKWKMAMGLTDIPYVGSKFTWCNKQLHGPLIFERLDRAYSTPDWGSLFKGSYLINLPIIHFDHGLIMLNIQQLTTPKGKPHKLDAWTLFRKEVKDGIQVIEQSPKKGSFMYILTQKLKRSKHFCKKWCLACKHECIDLWETLCHNATIQLENVTQMKLGLEATGDYQRSLDQIHLYIQDLEITGNREAKCNGMCSVITWPNFSSIMQKKDQRIITLEDVWIMRVNR